MVGFTSIVLALGALAARVAADHSISVVNNCGYGTPMMNGQQWEFPNGPINIAGGYYSSNDIYGFIVYLQTGNCGANGENCLIVEGTLVEPSTGQISAVDISRIYPHSYNVPTAFSLWPSNQGAACDDPNCACNNEAYCSPNDNGAIRGDGSNNVGVTIYFC